MNIFLQFAIVLLLAIGASAQIVGGYSALDPSDPQAQKAAEFAVATRAAEAGSRMRLVSVNAAEQQVVAGMNYRIDLTYAVGDRRTCAAVVVYKDLKDVYTLTSWKTAVCGESASDSQAGSFTEISTTHQGAVLAANAAVRELQKQLRMVIRLRSIKKAEMDEVVGGTSKFRLCLDIWSGKKRYAIRQAIVSMDGYNNFTVLSMEPSTCDKPAKKITKR